MFNKFFVILFLIFFGCATTVPVQVRKPAKMNIGSARTVAVLDFDFSGQWDLETGEKENKSLALALLNRIAKKKTKKPDAEKAFPGSRVSEMLVAKLVQNGYYTVIERSRIEEIMQEQSLALSGLVDENSAINIGQMLGAEALITGSGAYSVKDEGVWESYTETEKKNGKKVKVEKERYKITRNISCDITFRVIDVSSGSVTASKTIKQSNDDTQNTGDDEQAAVDGLNDWYPIVNELVDKILDKTVQQIAPHTITEKRKLEEGESKKMESALEYAKRDLWDEALEIWQEVAAGKYDKEDKIAAIYNLGVYNEIFGFYDKSEAFYEQCYKMTSDSKYLDDRARIKKRIKEAELLRQQEEAGIE